jgi:hypothetical protein
MDVFATRDKSGHFGLLALPGGYISLFLKVDIKQVG